MLSFLCYHLVLSFIFIDVIFKIIFGCYDYCMFLQMFYNILIKLCHQLWKFPYLEMNL